MKQKVSIFTVLAPIIIFIGTFDIAISTNWGRSAYRGILSFIVGRSNYTSAIIAAVLWLIIAGVIFFIGRNANKTIKTQVVEDFQTTTNNNNEILAANNFTPTSAHNLLSDYMMYVDSNSKRVAFAYLTKNNDITFIDFDRILSCEIVRGEETNKTTGMASHVSNGVGVGISTTDKRIASLKILLTLKSIDNPIYEIILIGNGPGAVLELGIMATVGGGIASYDVRFKAAVAFAEKVKSVMDNIIATRA